MVATETKHLHWFLASSTLAPYALAPPTLAFASCLCGSPVDTSLQQLQISLLGHSGSYNSHCSGTAASYTEHEEEAEIAAANTDWGQQLGPRQGAKGREGPA